MRLELDIWSDRVAKSDMVVNLAVHSKDGLPVFAHERLSTSV